VPWVRSWRAGLVSFDDVVDHVTPDDDDEEEHLCADLPDQWRAVSLREGLSVLARTPPDQIRLVLPAPGDPRGLPESGRFTGAALLAGECIIAGNLGLVPEVTTHTSGSGVQWNTVTWRAYPVEQPIVEQYLSTSEAEAELNEALAVATDQLASLDVARWRPEIGTALSALRRSHDGLLLPPGYDHRSRRMYARAGLLDGVLSIAYADAPGAAINAYEAERREAALRPLAAACRRALMAACNAPLSV